MYVTSHRVSIGYWTALLPDKRCTRQNPNDFIIWIFQ